MSVTSGVPDGYNHAPCEQNISHTQINAGDLDKLVTSNVAHNITTNDNSPTVSAHKYSESVVARRQNDASTSTGC